MKKNHNDEISQMKKHILFLFLLFYILASLSVQAQINTTRVLAIGKNALYFEDYVLSIQYFNQVIKSKPYLAEPYLYRAIAKLSLDDYLGAESDLTLCIERNPFIVYAYLYRGIARQSLDNFEGAIEDYDKTLEFRPEEQQALINKSVAYIQIKNHMESIKILDQLISLQPRYTRAYTTRGAVYAEIGDTLNALNDYNKALEFEKFYAPAYAQRALIYYMQKKYKDALTDFDEAIRLEPQQSAYYINRGLVRYNLNDLRGAMNDYNAVLTLDFYNTIARFNRGLLNAQVGDLIQAIADFSIVIQNEPENYMAVYNRAILNEEAKKYTDALDDLNRVIDEYPYFVPAYYFRSDIKRKMSDIVGADTDYWYAYDLERKLQKEKEDGKIVTGKGVFEVGVTDEIAENDDKKTREKSDKEIEKFNRLVVADRTDDIKSSYQNEMRGRVQDRQVKVDLEPQFVITYYEKLPDLDYSATRIFNSISDYNSRSQLRLQLILTNKEAPLTDQQAQYHFTSIDDYSLVLDRNPMNIDAYFGRALDFMVLQDLSEAIEDLDRLLQINPDFFMAYFVRAAIRYKMMKLDEYEENVNTSQDLMGFSFDLQKNNQSQQTTVLKYNTRSSNVSLGTLNVVDSKRTFEYEQIMQDYEKVIELQPDFAHVYFNRGNIRCIRKDFRTAITDYNEAISRKSDFAEAYFNRGLTRLYLGDTERGISDLSKAGELGMVNAYSIIKNMNTTTKP